LSGPNPKAPGFAGGYLLMSEQPPEETDNRPKNESNKNRRPSDLQRRIAEAVVLALYFVFEFPAAYQESRERAFVQVFCGVCAVLLIELTLKIWAITSALNFVLLAGAYLYLGPTPQPRPPKPTIGWLQPANEPTPDNQCTGFLANPPPNMKFDIPVLVLIGGNAVFRSRKPNITPLKHVALQLGDCPLVSLESGPNGA